MKVVIGIPCLLTGGTEIQTLSLVEALVAAGHNPIVACYFEYDKGMVARYEAAGAEVLLLSPDGTRPQGIKNTFKHLWKGLKKIVKDEKPDVAHIQYMAPGALPIIILRALGIKKIIATTHTAGDIYGKNGLRIIRFLTNHVLTAFQCITERAEKSYFGSSSLFNGTLNPHFTIYNNIPDHIAIGDGNRVLRGASCVSREKPSTVGVVSRLEPIKGMDLVIPAFAKACEQNPNLTLLVVGDGSLRELMESQAKDMKVGEKVTFVGRKPQSELQDYYDQIDILLMPSRSEGFGLTAIEGMARGCVPVVADTGGLPEVVTPDCGYLHRPEDVDDIADKIIEASNNLEAKREAAIQRASLFSSEVYKDKIKQLYSSL